ncbi:hypothetical protein AB6A40_002162 [Gnathostoma spinigerum]|uniref:Uncharacterized protein n=1 Tax=Gnathostoma spinigerum TaxID=75299 RepID=A0ABD6E610_9BILA
MSYKAYRNKGPKKFIRHPTYSEVRSSRALVEKPVLRWFAVVEITMLTILLINERTLMLLTYKWNETVWVCLQ